ncbi:hypothetical protein G6F37_013198 [Rhizopus arrhizus]|nr:hypothetical protein G6F37_013198 [Rhizopus arrhizus]
MSCLTFPSRPIQLQDVMNPTTTASTATAHQSNVHRMTVVACMLLSIWRVHWKVVFHDQRFYQGEIVAHTRLMLHRIHRENMLSTYYTLYGKPIPKQPSFPYLGIPFRPGGYLDAAALVNQNKTKVLATMNQLSAVGVHSKGFSPLLGTRFYSHIIRAQLEYGLAITKITTFLSKQLEGAQNVCLRRTFGGSHTSSTAMLCYTIFFHISASPEVTPNGTNSLGLPFGRDASPTQSPWIVAL